MKADHAFAISIGLVDGLITSLVIAAHAIVSHLSLSPTVAFRIAFGSSFVGSVSFFIAEFSKLSKDEFRVAKILKPGRKSPTIMKNLTEKLIIEALYGGTASFAMGFVGASVPLFTYSLLNNSEIFTLGCSYLALALFGVYTSKITGGSYIKWMAGLIFLGVLMTIVGSILRIVS